MERLTLYAARVVDGVVQIEQGGEFLPAEDVIIQGQGLADSSGYAVIGEAIALYFVNTQPDLQETIDQLIAVTSEIINVLDAQFLIGANTPVFGQNVDLQAIKPAIESIKTDLENLELK